MSRMLGLSCKHIKYIRYLGKLMGYIDDKHLISNVSTFANQCNYNTYNFSRARSHHATGCSPQQRLYQRLRSHSTFSASWKIRHSQICFVVLWIQVGLSLYSTTNYTSFSVYSGTFTYRSTVPFKSRLLRLISHFKIRLQANTSSRDQGSFSWCCRAEGLGYSRFTNIPQ